MKKLLSLMILISSLALAQTPHYENLTDADNIEIYQWDGKYSAQDQHLGRTWFVNVDLRFKSWGRRDILIIVGDTYHGDRQVFHYENWPIGIRFQLPIDAARGLTEGEFREVPFKIVVHGYGRNAQYNVKQGTITFKG